MTQARLRHQAKELTGVSFPVPGPIGLTRSQILISGPLSSSSPYPCITTVLRILLNNYRHYSTTMAYDPNIPVIRENQVIVSILPHASRQSNKSYPLKCIRRNIK